MENSRLTTFIIIIFVLIMHVLLFGAIFNDHNAVKIDNGTQSLNFVDLGLGKQADLVNSTVIPKTDSSIKSIKPIVPHSKPKLEKSSVKPQIRAIETNKALDDHFKVEKTDSKLKKPNMVTENKSVESKLKAKSELKSNIPLSKNDVVNQQNNASVTNNNDSSFKTNNDAELVVPKEYQGGFLAKLRPVYPAFSMENGEEGVVGISVSVSADGSPITVVVSNSSGYSRLDRAAKQAVQNYRFKPATKGGIPIPYKYHFNVRFSLNN